MLTRCAMGSTCAKTLIFLFSERLDLRGKVKANIFRPEVNGTP